MRVAGSSIGAKNRLRIYHVHAAAARPIGRSVPAGPYDLDRGGKAKTPTWPGQLSEPGTS